ncbi:MAG: hypothetical protein AVDCRST_MAG42-648 [uncultured Chthoniobacterales bacterium]|uniref:Uncharacterized protein n=1 Tax=uncultured Chthoniobacterales bacterium TaxID=1836801 RepID=A0A6J4HEC5_9BACT|nr:MAG: hypothetical protein AVDCRST_MAG42-648 [uncultured Chthoniobacterales bacterium]
MAARGLPARLCSLRRYSDLFAGKLRTRAAYYYRVGERVNT